MLRLKRISLTQFKNYSASSFTFNERVTGICGLNGLGKTNLLDAIHYLCFTKSYFSKSDQMNASFNSDGFRLEGNIIVDVNGIPEENRIVCIFRGQGKKEVLVNDIPYEKFSSHIGKFPCVMIAPDDIEMITGASEQRRRFIDTLLSQVDAEYLQQLITYNKVLSQRNSLLKTFAEKRYRDIALLDVLDEQMIVPGKIIHNKRKEWMDKLIPLAMEFYFQIADPSAMRKEETGIFYESQLNDVSFEKLMESSRDRDLATQRSNAGIHKDDLVSLLNGNPFRAVASQGQKKSLLFALKLAEFNLLKESKGFAPILLLDDVFEKLDDQRMHNLLKWVCLDNESQVFITDTHCDRLSGSMKGFGYPVSIIELR